MPGSHAEEIVGDYCESDDWAESFAEDPESEPDLELLSLPPDPEAAQPDSNPPDFEPNRSGRRSYTARDSGR